MSVRSMIATALMGAGLFGFHHDAQGAALKGKLALQPKLDGVLNISPQGEPQPGGGQLPLSIVRILSAQVTVQDPIANGLVLTKGTLNPDQAYGLGLANGYAAPPPNNPSGPWRGLMWPFRDFNDGYAAVTGGVTLGNDVGVIDNSMAAVGAYSASELIGAMSFSTTAPATYNRGVGGNGSLIATDFFRLEITSLVNIDREVSITLSNFRALILVRDDLGRLTSEEFSATDTTVFARIPAPATGAAVAFGWLITSRRRR